MPRLLKFFRPKKNLKVRSIQLIIRYPGVWLYHVALRAFDPNTKVKKYCEAIKSNTFIYLLYLPSS